MTLSCGLKKNFQVPRDTELPSLPREPRRIAPQRPPFSPFHNRAIILKNETKLVFFLSSFDKGSGPTTPLLN